MAQPRTQSFASSLFWPFVVLLSALIAGGIFAFVFAEIGGNGWRQGAGLGALVFVVAAFLFGRLGAGTLPPPNTVRIDPKPAPTVPRSTPKATPAPQSAMVREGAGQALEDAKEATQSTAERVKDAVKSGAHAVSGAVGAATPSNETHAPGETPTASARVTDAAKAAGEAARAMAEPVASSSAPETEAVKPHTLDAPRDGTADDLKKIKGVGPKLEELLHRLGFYHFDQIAAWGPPEVAWVDSNLEGFNGRATRDDWVGQAKVLAAGGSTEFSERVDKGDVYEDD